MKKKQEKPDPFKILGCGCYCKDCKHWHGILNGYVWSAGTCYWNKTVTAHNDFCSFGIRRDEFDTKSD